MSEVVVISGAAGMTGSKVSEFLLKQGISVVGFDNFFCGSREVVAALSLNKDFIFFEYDVCKSNHMDSIFNFVEDTYDVRRGKRHAQADGRTSPCLGERLQDNQVGKLVQARQEGRFFGEIIVRLVHNHQAVETVEQLHNLIPVQVVAGRVVGRTEEHQLRMLVGSFQHLLSGKLEMLVQQDFTIGHIVNLGRHQIHAVGRLNGYDIVPARLAKGPKHQVDGLITAIAQEDMLGSYTLQLGQILLQLPLQRIGIPVVGCIIGVLIGIKKD